MASKRLAALAIGLFTLASYPADAVRTVHIASMEPTSGGVGTRVTLTGSGFTRDNTVQFGPVSIPHVRAESQGLLAFSVPTAQNPPCFAQGCRMLSRRMTPGEYPVSVRNANGISNAVPFDLE